MSRNKRQPDVVADGSEGSTESSKEIHTDQECTHLKKALNDRSVRKKLKKHGITSACEKHSRRKAHASPKVTDNDIDHDRNVKNDDNGDRSNLNATSCSSTGPLWICLQCMHQSCGESEKNHAMEHYQNTQDDSHCVAVQLQNWDIWCYQCKMFIKADQSESLKTIMNILKKTPVKACQKQTNKGNSEKQKISVNYPKVGGIKNLGNTCFFNSVLQCLAQTPFLVDILGDTQVPGKEVIISGKKYKLNDNDEEIELPPIKGTLERNFGNFIPMLCETLKEMQHSNGQVIVPNNLLNAFKKKSMQCMDGEQHDAHELLRTLLEIVRTEDLKRYKDLILNEFGLNPKVDPGKVKDENVRSKIKMYGNQVTSTKLLGAELIFRGVLVCNITCCDCKNSVKRKEPFLDLSLPVMADKPQPPVISKRKSNNVDDNFDNYHSGNNAPRPPSKHQLKMEKRCRQRRYARTYHHHNQKSTQNATSFPPGDDLSNTISTSIESDADVEDNVETESSMPDNRESGYGMDESPTAPIPGNASSSFAIPLSYPGYEMNNDTIYSPTNNSETSCVKDDITSVQESDSPSAIDISMNEHTHDSDDAEVLNNSGNELHIQNGLTNTTSMTDKSDSPKLDESTSSISPLTKNSPTSPMSNTMDVDLETADTTLVPLLDDIESPKDTVRANNESLKTVENFNSINGQDDIMKNPHELCNGINEITSGLSKFEIPSNSHLSCDRYPTSKGECSIQSCLNQFTAPELMTNSNKVACEECTKRAGKNKTEPGKMVCTSSEIQYLISKVPPVLILHLKRFQFQRTGVQKITKSVKFPTILDLAPICITHKKPRIYSLYGVVVHSGSMHSGHYVAYVKSRLPLKSDDPRRLFVSSKSIKDLGDSSSSDSDFEEQKEEKEEASARAPPTIEPPPGKWYYASDQYVKEVNEEDVLKNEAYLLFYERIL